MKNRGLIATIVIMLGVIVVLLITLLLVKMPAFVTIEGLDFLKKSETIDFEETQDKVEETTTYIEIVEEPRIDSKICTYEGYNGHVTIEYPEISGLDDKELEKKINNKLKTNALSIVPLYPISTALQNLSIFCEVNYLDKNYVTVLYSGEVIGKDTTAENANSRTGSAYKSSAKAATTNANDPYLNGFVDPLAGLNNGSSMVTNIAEFSSLPLPKAVGTISPSSNTTTGVKSGAAQLNGVKSSANEHTADKGPTVYIEPAPVANRGIHNPLDDANNNPIGPGTTQGISTGAPVSGFASSSASTIDHKIFYANTIDLKTGKDVKLSDIVDPKTLAKYARSTNAEYVNISEELKSQVRTYIRKTVESKLAEELKSETDFRNTDLKVWPKHFSFVGSDGNIYFTIKLSSKLGNYVIIKYQK